MNMDDRYPQRAPRKTTHLALKLIPRHTRLGVQCQEEDGIVVVILLLPFDWEHQEMSKLPVPFRTAPHRRADETDLRVHSTNALFSSLLPYFRAEAHNDTYKVLGLVWLGDTAH